MSLDFPVVKSEAVIYTNLVLQIDDYRTYEFMK